MYRQDSPYQKSRWAISLTTAVALMCACKDSALPGTGKAEPATSNGEPPALCEASSVKTSTGCTGGTPACQDGEPCEAAVTALRRLVHSCLDDLQLTCAQVEINMDPEGCPATREVFGRAGETQKLTTCLEPKIKESRWPCAKGQKISAGVSCTT